MTTIDYLTQWAEPDGDQDTLADVRAEVRRLIQHAKKLETKLEAAKSVLWMAKEYAEAGGDGGPEMRDYRTAEETIDS